MRLKLTLVDYRLPVSRFAALDAEIRLTVRKVFDEMKFALNGIPETLINMLQVRSASRIGCRCLTRERQGAVSLRRIEKYLIGAEVSSVPPVEEQDSTIALQNATVTWPQERMRSASNASSAAATPRTKFVLMDLSITFPQGELSLICGKLGSGKTLLLLCENPPT